LRIENAYFRPMISTAKNWLLSAISVVKVKVIVPGMIKDLIAQQETVQPADALARLAGAYR
jgi:hypothetical protein